MEVFLYAGDEGPRVRISVTSIFLLKNLATPTRLVSLRLPIPSSPRNDKSLGQLPAVLVNHSGR